MPAADDVAGFRHGDPRAFDELMRRYSPQLMALARSYTPDDDKATDLVQSAWIRIFERRESFDGRGSLLGWMLAVCRREALMRLRSGRARTRAESGYSAAADEPSEWAEHPSDVESRSVHAALADLPPRQRDAVVLRLLEGRSTRETAAVMGCAEGTVKALLHQGVARLRSLLEDAHAT